MRGLWANLRSSLKLQSPKLKSSYKIGNKTMALDELKKLGYSEDQIKEAVKLGNIK